MNGTWSRALGLFSLLVTLAWATGCVVTPAPACGGLGQSCCGGNTCNVGVCTTAALCENVATCGAAGQACCSGNTCNAGNTCTTAGCQPSSGCGAIGQVCCAGSACNAGAVCNTAGTCQSGPACGNLGEICCAGGACVGAGVCSGGFCSVAAGPGIYEVCSGPCSAGTCQTANSAVGSFVGTFCSASCDINNPVCPANPNGGGSVACVPDPGSTGGQCYAACPSGLDGECPWGETCAMQGNGVFYCVP